MTKIAATLFLILAAANIATSFIPHVEQEQGK